jgi:hypothetical protein
VAVEGNWVVMLLDDGANLMFCSIGVDFEGSVEVWVGKTYTAGKEMLESVEVLLASGIPQKAQAFLGKGSQGCKKFGASGNVILVIIYHANEGADLLDGFWHGE